MVHYFSNVLLIAWFAREIIAYVDASPLYGRLVDCAVEFLVLPGGFLGYLYFCVSF